MQKKQEFTPILEILKVNQKKVFILIPKRENPEIKRSCCGEENKHIHKIGSIFILLSQTPGVYFHTAIL